MSYIYAPCRPCCEEPGGFPPPIKKAPFVSLYKMWPSVGSNLTRVIWAQSTPSDTTETRTLWPNEWVSRRSSVTVFGSRFVTSGGTSLYTDAGNAVSTPSGYPTNLLNATGGMYFFGDKTTSNHFFSRATGFGFRALYKFRGGFVPHPVLGTPLAANIYVSQVSEFTYPNTMNNIRYIQKPDGNLIGYDLGVGFGYSIKMVTLHPSTYAISSPLSVLWTGSNNLTNLTNTDPFIASADGNMFVIQRMAVVGGGWPYTYHKISTTTGLRLIYSELPAASYERPSSVTPSNYIVRTLGVKGSTIYAMTGKLVTGNQYTTYLDKISETDGSLSERTLLPLGTTDRLIAAYFDPVEEMLYCAVRVAALVNGIYPQIQIRKYDLNCNELWRYGFSALDSFTFFEYQNKCDLRLDNDGTIYYLASGDYVFFEA